MKCEKCGKDFGSEFREYGLHKRLCNGTGEVEDKPEMPERIWIFPNGQWKSVPCGNYPQYLPADKVRELVRLHEDFRDLLLKYRFTPGVPDELNAKAEEIDNLQSALFPEGLESEVKDEVS